MARHTAIGIDAGGTTTKAGLVTPDGEILARTERPTDASAATKGIIGAVDELLERAPSLDAEVVAAGAGVAGFIGDSTVIFSPNLVFDDPNVAAAIMARAGVPAVAENDANAAVWGERTYGAA